MNKMAHPSHRLSNNWYEVIKDIDIISILIHMQNNGAFNTKNASDVRNILAISDNYFRRQNAIDFLLKTLQRSSPSSREFQMFCSVLSDTDPKLLKRFLQKDQYQNHIMDDRYVGQFNDAWRVEDNRNNSSLLPTPPYSISSKKDNMISPKSHNLYGPDKPYTYDKDNAELGDQRSWQTFKVTLPKDPTYGFGIEISGGTNNPHYQDGDPSIVVTDVLPAGPANGVVRVHDRVTSANGISLERVEHATAIAVLRDAGTHVNLVIKRKIPPAFPTETQPLNVTIAKHNKKEDFGLDIGCRFFVKKIASNSTTAQHGGLKEDDTIVKINGCNLDDYSLVDAKKLIEKVKDKLHLVITKKRYDSEPVLSNGDISNALVHSYSDLRGRDPSAHRPQNEGHLYKAVPVAPLSPLSVAPFHNGPYGGNADHNERPHLDQIGSPYDPRQYNDQDAPPRPPLPALLFEPKKPGMDPSAERKWDLTDSRIMNNQPMEQRDNYQYNAGHGDHPDVGMTRQHRERYVGKHPDVPLSERKVCFRKDEKRGLGLRLAGGNKSGIFIAFVTPHSDAEYEGLKEGDEILHANEQDIKGMTREEAVLFLTNLHGDVTMIVQYRKEEYDEIIASGEASDSFFIKTHCSHEQTAANELSYKHGDIFHVKDTLFQGVIGYWIAIRLVNNEETSKGIIPNLTRATDFSSRQLFPSPDKETPSSSTAQRSGSIFRKKGGRRAKSLSRKDLHDFSTAPFTSKFPAYERVIQRDPGFMRPVVIYGPIASIAQERLIKEFPYNFQMINTNEFDVDHWRSYPGSYPRITAIKRIISQNIHCLLDITPQAVDCLNYAQFYPIVINLKPENKQSIKIIQNAQMKVPGKSPKKLLEESFKLEEMYKHLFTDTVVHGSTDSWFETLVNTIKNQQMSAVWMSEFPTTEEIPDDILNSVVDKNFSPGQSFTLPGQKSSVGPQITRSSSDPNLASHAARPTIVHYQPKESNYFREQQLTSTERYGSRPMSDLYPHQSVDGLQPQHYADHGQQRSDFDRLPPSDKHQLKSSDNYLHMDGRYPQQHLDSHPHSPNYKIPSPTGRENRFNHHDSSSHTGSSDSFTKHITRPDNQHDDSKLNYLISRRTNTLPSPRQPIIPLTHDPYKFTRSTAIPANIVNVDKARINDLTAKYRRDERQRDERQRDERQRDVRHRDERIKSNTVAASITEQQPKDKKLPPPLPPKNYTLSERFFRERQLERDPYSYVRSTAKGNQEMDKEPHSYNQQPLSNDSRSPIVSDARATHPADYNRGGFEKSQQYPSPRESYPSQLANHELANQQTNSYRDDYDFPTNHYPANDQRVDPPQLHFYDAENDRNYRNVLSDVTVSGPMKNEPQVNTYSTLDSRHHRIKVIKKNQQPDSLTSKFNGNQSPENTDTHKTQKEERLVEAAVTTDVRDRNSLLSSSTRSDERSTPETVATPDQLIHKSKDDEKTVVSSATGVFDSSGGVLESIETGVSLHIPPGAIAAGSSKEIYFNVCEDLNNLPPLDKNKGETLLSPVVMCGPPGTQFLQPVELRLPQCASLNPDSWSFALKCRGSLEEKQWHNIALSPNDGQLDKKSVSVLIDHF